MPQISLVLIGAFYNIIPEVCVQLPEWLEMLYICMYSSAGTQEITCAHTQKNLTQNPGKTNFCKDKQQNFSGALSLERKPVQMNRNSIITTSLISHPVRGTPHGKAAAPGPHTEPQREDRPRGEGGPGLPCQGVPDTAALGGSLPGHRRLPLGHRRLPEGHHRHQQAASHVRVSLHVSLLSGSKGCVPRAVRCHTTAFNVNSRGACEVQKLAEGFSASKNQMIRAVPTVNYTFGYSSSLAINIFTLLLSLELFQDLDSSPPHQYLSTIL